jgi:hypothetical protein
MRHRHYAGRKTNPIPQSIVQENAGVSLAEGSISFHFNISMNVLCFMTRLGLLAIFFVRALMACLKASQLGADTVEPNTIAVARLYNLPDAMKLNAPVKSVVAVGQLMRML